MGRTGWARSLDPFRLKPVPAFLSLFPPRRVPPSELAAMRCYPLPYPTKSLGPS
jgi:hypothetical protein